MKWNSKLPGRRSWFVLLLVLSGGIAANSQAQLMKAQLIKAEVMSEAESLTRVGFHSKGQKRIDLDPGYSGGKGVLLRAKKRGDFMAFTITVPRLATYDVRVGVKNLANGGIWQFSIDGVDYGPPADAFAPTPAFPALDMGSVVLTSGNHLFKFTVTGRNLNSAGRWIAIDYIKLLPQ